jgi:hypothetical protein
MAEKPCLSCGKPITFKPSTTRTKEDGSPAFDRFNPDGTPHIDERKNGGGGGYRGKSEAEMHDIRREAVLNAAVAFASACIAGGKEIDSAAVIVVADRFLKWVETGRPSS